MQRLLASLILMLVAVPAWAQIVVPAKVQLGEPIEATTPFDAKAYQWESDAQLKPHTDGKGTFVWAREGRHTITLIAVSEDYGIHKWTADFEVVDTPLPPTPATLRELVSDSEAKSIAEFLRALAGQVTKIADAAQFWSVWQQTFPVHGNATLDAALKARLDPAIEKKAGLSGEMRAIADEFAKDAPVPPGPTPPPVVEGKREVVIVHESADKTPEFGSLVVELRKPGTNADSYLKSHGHTLTILDDELIRESKWNDLLGSRLDQLPRLFIIDPQTNAILFEVAIPPGYTADQITERIRETGG